MDFFEVVRKRRSYRGAFSERGIPNDDLRMILDAGIRAPSGCNAQTTSFIAVAEPGLRAEIAAILSSEAVRTAPVLIVVLTEKVTFNFGLDFELEDYGAAVENILLAAAALGYASLWLDGGVRIGGADERIADLLSVREGKSVRCVLPVGVPVEEGEQPPRKPFHERAEIRG